MSLRSNQQRWTPKNSHRPLLVPYRAISRSRRLPKYALYNNIQQYQGINRAHRCCRDGDLRIR